MPRSLWILYLMIVCSITLFHLSFLNASLVFFSLPLLFFSSLLIQADDCWMAIAGRVYNVTDYMHFHPGGVPEVLRGAGMDATALFCEVHAWVNFESMLEQCLVGFLAPDSGAATASAPAASGGSLSLLAAGSVRTLGSAGARSASASSLSSSASQSSAGIAVPPFSTFAHVDCTSYVDARVQHAKLRECWGGMGWDLFFPLLLLRSSFQPIQPPKPPLTTSLLSQKSGCWSLATRAAIF